LGHKLHKRLSVIHVTLVYSSEEVSEVLRVFHVRLVARYQKASIRYDFFKILPRERPVTFDRFFLMLLPNLHLHRLEHIDSELSEAEVHHPRQHLLVDHIVSPVPL